MKLNVPNGIGRMIFGLIALSVILSGSLYKSHQKQVWQTEFRSVEHSIFSLRDRPPRGCSKQNWNNAVDRVWAGFANACHDPSTNSADSIHLLKNDIQDLIRTKDINSNLLRQIWKRIGETSSPAKRLIANHSVDFEDYVACCE